jgi:hypothetical protein
MLLVMFCRRGGSSRSCNLKTRAAAAGLTSLLGAGACIRAALTNKLSRAQRVWGRSEKRGACSQQLL